MTNFTFSIENPSQQYIHISAQFNTSEEVTFVQLPSWRPGRYQLADFAKNVRNFVVLDENNQKIEFQKSNKDCWAVQTKDIKSITVNYNFYANTINAGSSYLDATQLYVNPVNCCVYVQEAFNEPVSIQLNVPEHWEVASSMEKTKDGYQVASIEELLDTPFIASEQLQHREFTSHGVLFHVWFNGEVKPKWERLLEDFQKFTDAQINKFNEFPVKEYHFINLILPYKTYHGVEHQKSTVISLGPSYEVFGELYKELLGVSSHELYHTWNVKAIRPIEMFPYNFAKENYSKLGYLCEGVTTYQGDLFLFKSGVFNEKQYFEELTAQLQKHFDNFGRFNYSVAESSFDTWLDGYEIGAPNRKVSIYTEGCLLAFVTDVEIRRANEDKFGLDEVMKYLYFNFALKGKGVSEKDYQEAIENIAGTSFQWLFDDYIHGCRPFESIITNALDHLGIELDHLPSKSYAAARMGLKVLPAGKDFIVHAMYPGGPAETSGLMHGDKITAVNGFSCDGELDKWLNYFDDDAKTVTVNRSSTMLNITFPEVNRNFYTDYSIKKIEKLTKKQEVAYERWRK
jgi:predicted metalloprotease with PDZ domain